MEVQVINGTRFVNGLPLLPIFRVGIMLPFEEKFDQVAVMAWFGKRWSDSVYWCAGYLLAIFIGQKLMANRKPFKLRKPLFLWNLALAAFSILVCNSDSFLEHPLVGFWTAAFVISKLFELGDTAFIVLRKQKLIFLHWYHHITVFTYCWFSFQNLFGPARWFVTMNFTVHACMYSYYALRSIGIRVPKPLAMSITLAQIGQMFAGTFVTVYAFLYGFDQPDCPHVNSEINKRSVYFALAMYGSYLFLFCQFFVRAYLHGFGKAVKVTSGKASERLDENANKIEEKKVK